MFKPRRKFKIFQNCKPMVYNYNNFQTISRALQRGAALGPRMDQGIGNTLRTRLTIAAARTWQTAKQNRRETAGDKDGRRDGNGTYLRSRHEKQLISL